MNIVSICGSLRRASNTRIIESVLQSLAPAGMRVISAPPIGEIPFYNHDVQAEQGFPSSVENLHTRAKTSHLGWSRHCRHSGGRNAVAFE